MKFWDSSALMPLLVEEELTAAIRELFLGDPGVIAWWGTPVECASAIARLEREGRLSPGAATEALERLASEGRPSTLELVCLDDRLVAAAQREGFQVRDRSRL